MSAMSHGRIPTLNPTGSALCGLFAIAVLVTACGSGDDAAGGRNGGGESTFVTSGAHDQEFAGRATFTDASLALGQFSPTLSDSRGFALELSMPVGDNAPPAEGSYAVSGSYLRDGFSARLNLFQDGSFMNPKVYSAVGEGTLTITSSSTNLVEGTFSFEAEDDEGASIEVREGRFRAVQVRGGMSPSGG